MSLVDRQTPLPDRNEPQRGLSCHCAGDEDLQRLRALIADGMGQWEASRIVWPPPAPVVAVEPPPAITPRVRRPGRHARLLNRWINREVS